LADGYCYTDAMHFFVRKLFAVTCGLVLALPNALSFADDDQQENQVAYFERHIRPLLVSHCYSCHSVRAKKRKGGLRLDSRAGWVTGGDSGAALVPRDVDASLLIRAVRYSDPELQMPPDKALPPQAITLLERWVRMGAPDPRDAAASNDVSNDDPSDPIAGRQHWAFRPLTKSHQPTFASKDWPRSAIDEFVVARLETENLSPTADADRRILIRRIYIQLVGMPPTPEQVADFLSDDRSDAFARLVDELLDSPHFGERWGRHWLDLARYADSNGLDENFLFREAWRYRNRVIESFNSDMPFDRFLVEQIAGDLLPHDSIEQRDRQRTSAGFLVVGPKVLLGNNDNERRMDVADEQLDTIGRTVLGQTLGCARCHDHKFDPVPTADYYALAGIMTSTQVMERRHMLGQQRLMERLVGIGPEDSVADDGYEKYWREQKQLKDKARLAVDALELLKTSDAAALKEHARKHAETVADEAIDANVEPEKQVAAQQALVDRLAKAATPPPIPPRAMIPTESETPADEHIRLSGEFDQLGEKVSRGFLQVLHEGDANIPASSSGRLELARWLTDMDNGAGKLAARVLANRVWHHLIGRGIVRTVDNFGRTGEAPSHSELLDHLASELVESGWSIKSLIRTVVLSRTFAMSSRHNEAANLVDPDNRWLWRAHRRRLDPETLRDAMLLAAGTLDLTPMQSSVWYLGDQATAVGPNTNRRRTNFPNRSVYLPVIRNDLPELFDVFDFADPHATTGMRSETMVATQGLFILNDDLVMAAAEATARRLVSLTEPSTTGEESLDTADVGDSSAGMVDRMFELILNANPTDAERTEILSFIRNTSEQLSVQGGNDVSLQAWSIACHALFASSRFQIVE
jgi:hypothetical protein